MSNEKIRHYFHLNPNFRIEWLNDSACNIVYNTPEEAKEAFKPRFKGSSVKNEKN